MSKKLLIEDKDGNLIDLFPSASIVSNKLLTEDLGKIFEKAICMVYETQFDGKYNYSISKAESLKNKLCNLKNVFPHEVVHTAKNGGQYDFTVANKSDIKLSAKTTKKGYKVCPQVIGQPTKKKFCEHFDIDISSTDEQIKIYILKNISKLLKKYFKYTFDCPIVYYNEHKNNLWFITKKKDIDFDENCQIEFSHIKRNKTWNESTSIRINGYSMGEFQVHNHRDNIKFRWNLLNMMKCFHYGKNNEYFKVVDLHTNSKII